MMNSCIFIALLAILLGACSNRQLAPSSVKDDALAQRINGFVETIITSDDDDAKQAPLLAEAKAIFEREGVPSVAKVGDAASYGFVLVNMLGQTLDFQNGFVKKLREAQARRELPPDALVFAEAKLRQATIEQRISTRPPTHPALRDEILRLLKPDQAVREKDGFDAKKMAKVDRQTALPLRAIFKRHGVPTYDMVGVEAAKDFIVMVQHQSPEFRQAVLPKLKFNVDSGQADAGNYAMVYDRTQRDQGKKQLYGSQLECLTGQTLREAPIEEEATVNLRRAELGLFRVELYARLVKLYSPNMCGATSR